MNIDKQKVECIQADRMNNGTLITVTENHFFSGNEFGQLIDMSFRPIFST